MRPRGNGNVQFFVAPSTVITTDAEFVPLNVMTSFRDRVVVTPSMVIVAFIARVIVPAVG